MKGFLKLGEVVEVGGATWIVVEAAFVAFWGVTALPHFVEVYGFITFAYVLLFLLLILTKKVSSLSSPFSYSRFSPFWCR